MHVRTFGIFIYLITRGTATASNFAHTKSEILGVIRQAAADGVSHIQLREKFLPTRLLFELAFEGAKLLKGTRTKLLVNERADVAVAAGADGVHLPADSVPVVAVRSFTPDEFLVGVSAHNLAEVLRAREAGADFATIGPIFESPGKGDPLGIGSLAEITAKVDQFPVVGLGGIDRDNFNDVLGAGASGFAAIRCLNNSRTRSRILRSLRSDCGPFG